MSTKDKKVQEIEYNIQQAKLQLEYLNDRIGHEDFTPEDVKRAISQRNITKQYIEAEEQRLKDIIAFGVAYGILDEEGNLLK